MSCLVRTMSWHRYRSDVFAHGIGCSSRSVKRTQTGSGRKTLQKFTTPVIIGHNNYKLCLQTSRDERSRCTPCTSRHSPGCSGHYQELGVSGLKKAQSCLAQDECSDRSASVAKVAGVAALISSASFPYTPIGGAQDPRLTISSASSRLSSPVSASACRWRNRGRPPRCATDHTVVVFAIAALTTMGDSFFYYIGNVHG